MKIFISHISDETALAQELKTTIRSDFLGMADIFVSSDKETIQVGSKWLESLENALKESHILIVLCSRESISKPWVNFEAGAAWVRNIPIIPICHSGMELNDLPPPLSMLHGISTSDEEGLPKLYKIISQKLGVQEPKTDLKDLRGRLLHIQEEYMKSHAQCAIVKNPKVLCAASTAYNDPDMGFQSDINILTKSFPDGTKVVRNLSKESLTQLLSTEKYDIIHLVAEINPQNGDILFDANSEALSANGFARLIAESETKLVVLATCNSLLLAVEVCKYANMIASETIITTEQVENWASYFYGLLSKGKSLVSSFDITRTMVPNLPIRAIIYSDISFQIK